MSGSSHQGPKGGKPAQTRYTLMGLHGNPSSVNQYAEIVVKQHQRQAYQQGERRPADEFISKKPQKQVPLSERTIVVAPGVPAAAREKFIVELRSAFREMVAGEWFRLMNPGQPKVRMHITQGSVRVLSRILTGFIPLANLAKPLWCHQNGVDRELLSKVQSGQIPGLAAGAFSAISTLNSDLHLGNIGVALNKQKQYEVFVIDPGQCYFPRIIEGAEQHASVGISARDLENFPFITEVKFIDGNYLHNFLGIIKQGRINDDLFEYTGRVWGKDLGKSDRFIQEKYARILCEVLMPDTFVEHFMLQYVQHLPEQHQYARDALEEEAKFCATLHNERKADILAEAFQVPGFIEYLKSPQAQKVVEGFIQKMLAFHTKGKNTLWLKEGEVPDEASREAAAGVFLELFEELKTTANSAVVDAGEVFHDAQEEVEGKRSGFKPAIQEKDWLEEDAGFEAIMLKYGFIQKTGDLNAENDHPQAKRDNYTRGL